LVRRRAEVNRTAAPWKGSSRNGICAACLEELHDPRNRRYRYPFIACAECGPGFTITRRLPYVRANTTMAPFLMCEECRAEYEDPSSRFHGSPTVSCPECGPSYWIEPVPPPGLGRDVVEEAAQLLGAGRILAVKDGCSFRLLCRAREELLVRRLRRRKQCDDHPLGVLVRDLSMAAQLVELEEGAAQMLASAAAPLVLLPRRKGAELAPSIAPGFGEIGIILPRSPFLHLLMEELGEPLAVTSATRGGEVAVLENEEARELLMDIADHLVLHDLELHAGCEDSVVRMDADGPLILRRSSGFAPAPVPLCRRGAPEILALGGLHEATFAIAHEDHVHLSPPMGDLDSARAVETYRELLDRMLSLWQSTPEWVAFDQHPLSLGFKIRDTFGVPSIGVDHHHAHVASVLVEHRIEGPVLGVSLDATTHRFDSNIGRGEFLECDGLTLHPLRRTPRFRVPGAEAALRDPWRTALGMLFDLVDPEVARRWALEKVAERSAAATALSMLESGSDCISITSFGRLYDGVAALLGICQRASYDGQAVALLEAAAGRPAPVELGGLPPAHAGTVDYFSAVLGRIVEWGEDESTRQEAAAWAQVALAHWVGENAVRLAVERGIGRIVAGGGCLVSPWLRTELRRACEAAGLGFHCNQRVPPGDGGLALGQAWIVAQRVAAGSQR
jgi:hydrogenase maturation protein HypF